MISLTERSVESELMDGEAYDPLEYATTLKELELINQLTFATGPTLKAIEKVARRYELQKLKVVDIGFGHGDMLRRLRNWSDASGIGLELVGIDLNPRAALLADRATPSSANIRYVTGDIFHSQDIECDIMINSLFMHHLTDAQIVQVLRLMTEKARFAWHVNDLHRHFVPYYFIKHVTRLFRFSRLIANDAPLSVARGFQKEELDKFLNQAGLPLASVEIKWHMPFRFGLLCDTQTARQLS